MLDERARRIIQEGSVKLRVKRSGMLQLMTFTIKHVSLGGSSFVELYTNRVIEMGELQRLAAETGLPVEAEGKRAFPTGKGAKDFIL